MIRSVHLRDLGGWFSRIPKERHAAAVKAIRKTMKERGRGIVRQEIDATSPRPFDRGDYARSWFAMSIKNGARLYSKSVYASVIDRGRRPGTLPNVQALMGWVKRKGLVERSATSTIKKARSQKTFMGFMQQMKMPSMESQVRRVALAIAFAIKKRGIPAKNVFKRASKRLIWILKQDVRMAIAGATRSDGGP